MCVQGLILDGFSHLYHFIKDILSMFSYCECARRKWPLVYVDCTVLIVVRHLQFPQGQYQQYQRKCKSWLSPSLRRIGLSGHLEES